MKVTFELSPTESERLQQKADRRGVAAEEVAKAALVELLAAPDAEFERVAARVLEKNDELYRRLA